MALSNAERQKRMRDRRRRELADLRKDKRTGAGKYPDRVRRDIRDALRVLAGGPTPERAAEHFIGTDEAPLVAERLGPALAWLKDFAVAFRKATA
jgi:hypothetical protein